MSKEPQGPCEYCFNDVSRYGAICPICKETRWERLFRFCGKSGTASGTDISPDGICIVREKDGQVWFYGDLDEDDPRKEFLTTTSDLTQRMLFTSLGYFWENTATGEEFPEEEFPPMKALNQRLQAIPRTIRRSRSVDDRLTQNDWKLLGALKNLGATSRQKRVTQSQITQKARTGYCGSEHNKQSFKRLKALNFIDTIRGEGTWLTKEGDSHITSQNVLPNR
jgi:hypothetical protein